MPKSLYLEMVKCDENEIDWSCRVCKTTKSDLKSIGATLTELEKSSDARLSKVETQLANLETSVKDTVREEVENAKETLSDSIKINLAETVEEIVNLRIVKTGLKILSFSS